MKNEKDIYKMKLHDAIVLRPENGRLSNVIIMRVPGGWLYTKTSSVNAFIAETFVPFHNEFQSRDSFSPKTVL